MAEVEVNLMDFKQTIQGVEKLPDGAFNISEASPKLLKANIQTNDALYLQYIRNNGISRVGIMFNGTYLGQFREAEGQIYAEDLLAKAYFRSFFPDIWWMSSIQVIPTRDYI